MRTIVIADDEPITRMDLREMLEEVGYNVVGEASDGFDAIELCKKFNPSIVIMDIKMPLLDGIKASNIIISQELAGAVVLLTAYSDRDFIEEAKKAGIMGYLVKPIEEKSLIPTLEIAEHKGREIRNIKKIAKETKEKLDARKVIEKAKGILMREYNLCEEEAYQKLRKLSMDKRCTMKDIASIIIMNQ
ncbi:response regulator NasT [Clostridium tetanomorphum]|uniref:Stage 0 sporulation protein A homolog n=1 Tax=Clostridium tetanomorphum TaxID=1553 RepID=A0A923J124_CLOTT|nr:ANTAR domain-containing response regulator [Clostridium tetanomorphum]KAJ52568.1 response regulator receiver/ANTAR domain-containing protein [Clostridium tetanomorphum DSM 665]MBC2396878.1 ANTAR domain-containing response regulator [Clostridium tetanomorphum]MBP1863159.1 response regulator NasT [Clostridium tetanomorphum]NRS84267.1 response regulator NasT [Clostridium tetanomorphum]NRZ97481.1 response regulator NasT [Clostridium tetanomorphum]